jgi:hypothetical protein
MGPGVRQAFAGTTMDRAPCKYLMLRVQRLFISTRSNSPRITRKDEGADVMERRHFLRFAVGFAAGAAALAASAHAAPLAPAPIAKDERLPPPNENAIPAVTTEDEVSRLKPEQVRWGHHWHHRHWRHRHWGWRHRHWGWRHRHWRRWHRRYW